MSKELTGQGGYIVGSQNYFRSLNEKTFIANFMQNKSGTSYYEALTSVSSKIYAVFDEIYSDLTQHIKIIQYIPKNDRENLTKVILGLYDVCKITSGNGGKCDDCIRILSLSSYETRSKSNATDREIDEAVQIILNGRYLNSSDRMDTIKRAIEWGENNAIGSSTEKAKFLSAVMQGKNREFLGDVWLKLLYTNNPKEFTGRCGRVICTSEYIDHIEQHVFGGNIPNYYAYRGGDRAYGNLTLQSLSIIASTLISDLRAGKVGENYMTKQNYFSVIKAYDELCRFSGLSSILSGFISVADQFYTDLLKEIEKLKRESKDIDIKEYDEWTNGDAVIYFFDKYLLKSSQKIEAHKKKYVVALSEALKDLEWNYDIPAVMLAGIAYMEFGGDPPIQDYVAHCLRTVISNDPTGLLSSKSTPSYLTSFGNISMQLRRAAELLDDYGKLDYDLEKELINVLNNDKTALILVARHLVDLKNIDFSNKKGTDLIYEEMAVVVGRYNVGPNVSKERAGSCGYAQRFRSMISKLQSWIK